MKEEIILIGGGGHCRACIDVIETNGKYRIAGIVDTLESLHSKVLLKGTCSHILVSSHTNVSYVTGSLLKHGI